jgi:hypothetical protein
VDDGKAKAGALANRLGGEKGVENAIESGAIHATTIITDGETDVGPLVQTRGSQAIVGSDDATG